MSFLSVISSSSIILSVKLLTNKNTNKIYVPRKYLAIIFLLVNPSINITNGSTMEYCGNVLCITDDFPNRITDIKIKSVNPFVYIKQLTTLCNSLMKIGLYYWRNHQQNLYVRRYFSNFFNTCLFRSNNLTTNIIKHQI
jgi:hypothetical protein